MITTKIISYGSGNIGSIATCFSSIGFPVSLVEKNEDIEKADLLILPGVGSAISAVKELKKKDLWNPLNLRNVNKKPILGICLGTQLFFSYLEESNTEGLGWFQGSVKRFKGDPSFNNGWCQLIYKQLANIGLARGLNINSTFYFNHQYYLPKNLSLQNVCILDNKEVPAIIKSQHICGIQFHPEKSQKAGRIILRNLLLDYYGF
tara:strand:- start:2384 stop:2998 length:615 start_codon:yes stop_codon:yes gene_type:complete